jgi:hypothetical protein
MAASVGLGSKAASIGCISYLWARLWKMQSLQQKKDLLVGNPQLDPAVGLLQNWWIGGGYSQIQFRTLRDSVWLGSHLSNHWNKTIGHFHFFIRTHKVCVDLLASHGKESNHKWISNTKWNSQSTPSNSFWITTMYRLLVASYLLVWATAMS